MIADIYTYIPFVHKNFNYVKTIIQMARDSRSKGAEGTLAASLIYMNAIDYIAAHLLENFKAIEYLITYQELNATIFKNIEENPAIPLGRLIGELEKFEFPDKNAFIADLGIFNKCRTKLAHNLLRLNPSDIESIDPEIADFWNTAERLFNRYDLITRNIAVIFDNYRQAKGYILPTTTVENNQPVYQATPAQTETGVNQ